MKKSNQNFSFCGIGCAIIIVMYILFNTVSYINKSIDNHKQIVEKKEQQSQVLTDLKNKIPELLAVTTVTSEYLDLSKEAIVNGVGYSELSDSLATLTRRYEENSKRYIDDNYNIWEDKWSAIDNKNPDYVKKQLQNAIGFDYMSDLSSQKLVSMNFNSLRKKMEARSDEIKKVLEPPFNEINKLNLLTTMHPANDPVKAEIQSNYIRLNAAMDELSTANEQIDNFEIESRSDRIEIAKISVEHKYEHRYFDRGLYHYEIEGKLADDGFYQDSSDFAKAPDGSDQVKEVFIKTVMQDNISFIVKISIQSSYALGRYYHWIDVQQK
jgi:hypothetical protein